MAAFTDAAAPIAAAMKVTSSQPAKPKACREAGSRDIELGSRRAARELTGAHGATFVLRDNDLCYYADEDAIIVGYFDLEVKKHLAPPSRTERNNFLITTTGAGLAATNTRLGSVSVPFPPIQAADQFLHPKPQP